MEQQAFGRVFRIGQNKESYLTRLVVQGTIDTRMLALQKAKIDACESAMRSGKDELCGPLTVQEMASLLGTLTVDSRNRPIRIDPDNDAEVEELLAPLKQEDMESDQDEDEDQSDDGMGYDFDDDDAENHEDQDDAADEIDNDEMGASDEEPGEHDEDVDEDDNMGAPDEL